VPSPPLLDDGRGLSLTSPRVGIPAAAASPESTALFQRVLLWADVTEPDRLAASGLIVTTANGTPLRSALWRIGVKARAPEPDQRTQRERHVATWLGLPGPLTAAEALQGPDVARLAAELPIGRWAVEFDLPAADNPMSPSGDLLIINGLPVEVTRYAESADPARGRALLRAAAERIAATFAGRSNLPPRSELGAGLAQAAASPVERWRAEYLCRALGVRTPELGEPGAVRLAARPDDPLELWSRQAAWRCEAALGRLAAVDPRSAETLAETALAVGLAADATEPLLVPLWPSSTAGNYPLDEELLDPRRSAEELRDLAAAQLSAGLVAWVIDDGGQRDALTGNPVATLGIANTTGTLLAVGVAAGTRSTSTLEPLQPRHLAQLRAPVPTTAPGTPPGSVPLTLESKGGFRSTRLVRARALPVVAGLGIGPFARDWTLAALSTDLTLDLAPIDESALKSNVVGPYATAATLVPSAGTTATDRRWVLYIECATPEAPAVDADSVRIWLGPFGNPTAVLRVWPDGRLADQTVAARAELSLSVGRASGGGVGGRGGAGGGGGGATVQTVRDADGRRWAAWVPIPPHCFERDGTLRLGLERVDARAVRSAWPRPMLPWQVEPGRAALDTTAWDRR
jgi:hypothetical protein